MADDPTSVPLREHFEALRQGDQRAIDLLAKSNADRIKTNLVVISMMISTASIIVAIAAVIFGKH
jgi:hypothetical protein